MNKEYINKQHDNVGTLPFLKMSLYSCAFRYKLSKYDAIGAIEKNDWTVVIDAVQWMLRDGLCAYFCYKGYNSIYSDDYVLFNLLSEVKNLRLIDDKTYVSLRNLMFFNDVDRVYDAYEECIRLVENVLLPKEVWKIIGEEGVMNWNNWMDVIIDLKQLTSYIKWNHAEIAPMNDCIEWENWRQITKEVFEIE